MATNVIAFPQKRKQSRAGTGRQGRRPPRSERVKYFTGEQIRLIRRTARDAAELAAGKGRVTAVRVWMLIDLLTNTGLREGEAAALRCGDLKLAYGEAAIYVANGKGGRSRTVQIPKHLKTHLGQYLRWKESRGESVEDDAPLFVGQRGALTKAGVADAVKVLLKQCRLYSKGKKVHALRHSYAIALYRKERDLRAVQKQLGHASITTTQIYADVLDEDIREQLDGGIY
jgi:site-specific recombinase XerD